MTSTSPTSTASEILAAIAPLASEPRSAAAFFDLDGTLAPIAERPEQTQVPSRTRELVGRIGERYALTGVITGRQASEARRIVGLQDLTYVGNHGLELLAPGAASSEPAPGVGSEEQRLVAGFVSGLDRSRLERAGLRLEDKAAIVALHWRGASDEAGAQAAASEIAAEAEAAGLHTQRGRLVVELRPPVSVDKGTGLRSLLKLSPVRAAFYAGDDRTDADAFRALGELREAGSLELVVRVAVLADESPPELTRAADLTVGGPEGFLAVLEALA